MSNEKVKIDFGCGTSLIPGSFLILLIAKVLLHSNISWWIVFSPLLIGLGLIIILCIIGLILYCIPDERFNRYHKWPRWLLEWSRSRLLEFFRERRTMNSDTAKIKANKAWKTLIAKSSYLLMSSRELEKCKVIQL